MIGLKQDVWGKNENTLRGDLGRDIKEGTFKPNPTETMVIMTEKQVMSEMGVVRVVIGFDFLLLSYMTML